MRADRYEQDGIEIGIDKRASAGESIGRGARRCGDDNSIGALRFHEAAVYHEFEFDHARRQPFVQHHVIECEIAAGDLSTPILKSCLQKETRILLVVSCKYLVDACKHFVSSDIREETQPPAIHPDDRYVIRRQDARGMQQGAITADDNNQIGCFGKRIERCHSRARQVFLEAFVESQLVAAFEQMLPETFQQRGKLLVMGFSGDADMIEQG